MRNRLIKWKNEGVKKLEPVALWLGEKKVHPNHLTWTGLGLALISGWLFSAGYFGFGGFFAGLSGLLDALDGMVARRTGQGTPAGVVLDSAVDRYSDAFVLFGLAFFYRRRPIVMLITLLALLGSFMISYSTAKAEAVNVEPPSTGMKREERWLWIVIGGFLSALGELFIYSHSYSAVRFQLPMVLAVTGIAVWSNYSAIVRLAAVARANR